ncbi:tRNA (adenosine(37)-N6)-dimethylallyltransferase MiaA [Candidatus Aerophobetes bacterium]|uniref:tRNA dimethylallyltransferase n=1 Tax=Aerophobetes bacterium TaxID=2030807 RepID=A0A2A4X850_UNCAE|nr:MAG: tRNA (adenosine(37)-N6)-dimethylallyltransferase MiaA [Candidatus Aerophobetes bacterium]
MVYREESYLLETLVATKLQLKQWDSSKKPVIVIAGPTAVGKTALSLQLAKEMGGEIISADSIQVYKGLDIGSSKPSFEEMSNIPHHLINICDLTDSYNVVHFYAEAKKAIREVQERGNVPIVVGGTGFYVNALLYGPPSGPPSSMQVRDQLAMDLEKRGIEALYDRLKKIDPDYSKKITVNDKQKIIRGLEIIAITGKRVSDFKAPKDRRGMSEYNFRCFFLYTPRETLYPKIEVRCDEMLSQGLIEEVEQLLLQGLADNPSASASIGYRQCIDYLKSEKSVDDFEKFVETFKTMTRRYAKRQFTWFRREPLFRWLDIEVHGTESVRNLIMMDYESQI